MAQENERMRVLVLCTQNSARSQMAEGLFRQIAADMAEELGGDGLDVYSAGFEPAGVNPLAIEAMAEEGIDISGQWSKSIDEYLGRVDFDYVITVCGNAEERCPFFPGNVTRLHWPTNDPAAVKGNHEVTLAAFRSARDSLQERVENFMRQIYQNKQ